MNNKILKEVQKIQLEILKEVDTICKNNNIKYHLFAGTLLGSVRHGGFIPWDDDIDIAMLRDDYEKFLIIAKKEISEKYHIQNINNEPNLSFTFTKIRKKETLFVEKSKIGLNINHGIFIDIFPLDRIDNKTIKGKTNLFISKILVNTKIIAFNKIVWNKKKGVLNIFKYPIKLFRIIPSKLFNKLIFKSLTKYNNSNSNLVAHLTNRINKTRLNRFTFKIDQLINLTESRFEDKKFPIPKEYH